MVKNLPANAGDRTLIPGLDRCPQRRKWQPTPAFLQVKSHGQKSLVGYRPWGLELDMTECMHVRAHIRTHTHTHTSLDYFIQRPQNTHCFPKLTWNIHQYPPRFALKTHLHKFKRTEAICLPSDHRGIKLEISNRKIAGKFPNI